ncbi:hypothetical protein [Holdemania filiformis]|uniref:Uncharacterized protein n=1 Tax=Holdemania filiformis DSM 12042 TaxID=545696 RepID=B9YCE5_9FIRM|nr:hypothetical protein [Holdemania filiformis]EEF66374.1 hypothetical protein HOLDEFILI_03506 [Holdemania filiformis DSM 12042]
MITLINRLLQTEKRRICILFCTGCFCAAVFAFANARMGYLLVQLRSIEDVLALTHHPWVEGTWLGRTILNLLATPLAFSDWLSSAVTALAWPQIGFLLVAAMFFTQRGKDKNLRRKRRGLGCLIGCELVMVIAGGFFCNAKLFFPHYAQSDPAVCLCRNRRGVVGDAAADAGADSDSLSALP